MRPIPEISTLQLVINYLLMFTWTLVILSIVTAAYYLGIYIKDRWG